jgi:hypothetical protein
MEGVGTVRFYGENEKLVELNYCPYVPLLDVNVMYLAEVSANGGEVYAIGNRLEAWLHHVCGSSLLGTIWQNLASTIRCLTNDIAMAVHA